MCGIALILGPDAENRREDLEHMLAALEHRGERTGHWMQPSMQAGVRRLPITNPSGSHQPLAVEMQAGTGAVILFNGEIYNYPELRDELSMQSAESFRTAGDTEVLLRAWLQDGRSCLPRLRGQFAFVIVQGEDVFAVRDPLGIKPLYFARRGGCTYIASEVKALTFLNERISECEPGRVYRFHTASIEQTVRVYEYYEPNPGVNSGDVDWIGRVRAAVEDAVRLRARTDLPLGVVYSGGVDSSIVLELAARQHDQVIAFTAGRADSEDFRVSQRFCRERGIRQVLVSLSSKDLNREIVREAVRTSELTEYGDVINAVVSLPLFRAVRAAGVKVVLTGDGSDELFAGYSMYAAKHAHGDEADRRLFLYKLMNLHRTELQRVDRCSMAATVEARVPFLDQEVVKTALAMPDDFKIRGGVEKWCLREAFRRDLPDYIVNRPKNPLSHSSGLHEIVRMRKYMFASAYRQAGYELKEPMRADFSYILRSAGYDLEQALKAVGRGTDYSRLHFFTEALKAGIRRFSR